MKLSSNALKWIAMAAMLIDHTGLVILQYWLEYGGGGGAPGNFLWTVNPETLGYVAYGMRILGRAAFPIYGFLLTEGFLHTRDCVCSCFGNPLFPGSVQWMDWRQPEYICGTGSRACDASWV